MLDRLVGEARRRWGLEPGAGLQVVAAESLVATPIEASRPLLIVPLAVLAGAPMPDSQPSEPLAGRNGSDGRDPLAVLGRLYPADHAVGRPGTADETADITIGGLVDADLGGPLYLSPIDPELASAGPWSMPYIAARLRRPDGCPWDREQTHQSLRKHLLEETYEVYDALEHGATPALAEELGDLLLQVVLHAQLAAEAGVFDLADVQASIARKIVRRHPHVFGDAVAETSADVLRQWERIKAVERAEASRATATATWAPGNVADPGDAAASINDAAIGITRVSGSPGSAPGTAMGAQPGTASDTATDPQPRAATGAQPGTASDPAPRPKGALDGISNSMPALAASQEMQERAAALGYDWPDIEGVLDKVAEELGELARAATDADRREEFGDLLLVVANVGRKMGIETEAALRAANEKFRRRFRIVERMVAERGVAIRDLDFATLDELWQAAKAEERAT
ncbi:MAG: nucleoside triphosphate pyrophosphohydrolase [Candidatus Limnocylindrales bacterium]